MRQTLSRVNSMKGGPQHGQETGYLRNKRNEVQGVRGQSDTWLERQAVLKENEYL